jgi:glycerophosphoryl diester phosphodiesterase
VRFFETPRPRLFAHRGASGLRPENTLDAFAAGLEDGASILEMDVHASSDGQVVVIHDDTLDRTTDGTGPVSSYPLTELRKLDAGYRFVNGEGEHSSRGKGIRIPTFSEVLYAFPDASLNVEIKQLDPPIEPLVFELLERACAWDRVLLAAGEDSIMARIRAGGHALTGFSESEATELVGRCASGDLEGYRPPGVALQVPHWYQGIEVVTPALVRCVHALDVEVHVWTVNEEIEMETLLDIGVDGIMSDYPGRGAHVLSRRGLAQRIRGLD